MDLKERLLEAVRAGQERADEAKHSERNFASGWRTKIDEIERELKTAAPILQEAAKVGWFRADVYDLCAMLEVGNDVKREQVEYKLDFCSDPSRQRISCRIFVRGKVVKEESFSLEGLTLEVVHENLETFVREIFEAQTSRPAV
jgi:hypothetical protein